MFPFDKTKMIPLDLELKHRSGKLDAIHFVGIGGIGMSGIATILHHLGYKVQGSDIAKNSNTKRLEDAGIKVYIGHHGENIQNVSFVVVSTAIDQNNPEIKEALLKNIPVIRRAEMLAELMRSKCSVAISGTHGKTTTTSLVASVFEAAGLSPTVINGGIIQNRATNAYLGSSNYFITEADESDATFLYLPSTVAVITNIDADHLDFYKDFERLICAFKSFILNLPLNGFAVACIDHKVVRNLIEKISDRKIITYGIESEDADIQAFNIDFDKNQSKFDVKINHPNVNGALIVKEFILNTLGQHNILNALAAISVAIEFDFDMQAIKNGLKSFQGVKRRFTKIMEYNGAIVIDDYAHHPEEVRATLATARLVAQKQNGKIIAIFQPHRYSRVKYLFDVFVNCFNEADQLYVTDIYGAGEQSIEGITGQRFVEHIQNTGRHRNASFIANSDQIPKIVEKETMPGDIVVMMGAGSISSWANNLPSQLKQNRIE